MLSYRHRGSSALVMRECSNTARRFYSTPPNGTQILHMGLFKCGSAYRVPPLAVTFRTGCQPVSSGRPIQDRVEMTAAR